MAIREVLQRTWTGLLTRLAMPYRGNEEKMSVNLRDCYSTEKEIYQGNPPNGFRILRAERKEMRLFYDSKWFIETTSGNVTITRYDNETAKSFSELQECRSLEDVRALCLRDRIWYD